MKKIAVILSGCGIIYNAKIHETSHKLMSFDLPKTHRCTMNTSNSTYKNH